MKGLGKLLSASTTVVYTNGNEYGGEISQSPGRLLELEWSIWVIPPESTTGLSETILDLPCVVICRCVRNMSRSHLRKIPRKGFRWELSANSRTTDQVPGSLQEELVSTPEPFSTTCNTYVHLLSVGPDGSLPWFWTVLFIYLYLKMLMKGKTEGERKEGTEEERGGNKWWMDGCIDGWNKLYTTNKHCLPPLLLILDSSPYL